MIKQVHGKRNLWPGTHGMNSYRDDNVWHCTMKLAKLVLNT